MQILLPFIPFVVLYVIAGLIYLGYNIRKAPLMPDSYDILPDDTNKEGK